MDGEGAGLDDGEAVWRGSHRRMRDAGARIVSLEMVAFEWLRTSEHPMFKNVLRLIKEVG